MHPHLMQTLAQDHQIELMRDAARRRLANDELARPRRTHRFRRPRGLRSHVAAKAARVAAPSI